MKKSILYIGISSLVFIALLTLICFYIKFTSVYVNNSVFLLEGKIVVIDAGHGGEDPGKVGKLALEKDLNLDIALKTEAILKAMGAKVILTRDSDSGLTRNGKWEKSQDMKLRKEIILSSGADLMISIHMNSHTDASSNGAQIFCPSQNEESFLLAEYLKKGLSLLSTESERREIIKTDELYIITNNPMPSTIIECGFLSNENEEKLLNDSSYREKIAYRIASALAEYLLKQD